jgi:hypothetical protein
MTALKNTLGDNAKYVSGHASDSVGDKNYIDKLEVAIGMDDFKIFADADKRSRQINRLRNNKRLNSRSINENDIQKLLLSATLYRTPHACVTTRATTNKSLDSFAIKAFICTRDGN